MLQWTKIYNYLIVIVFENPAIHSYFKIYALHSDSL